MTDRRKFAIIGREATHSSQVKAQLEATFHDLEIFCIPFITTKAVPFDLPEPVKPPLYLFSSPRAVDYFFRSSTIPDGALVASIGFATTKALCDLGVSPHFTSSVESAKGMAPELLQYIQINSQQFHIIQPTSNIAGEYLKAYFSEKGFEYSRITTYEVTPNPDLQRQLALFEGTPEWVLYYSPSGVRAWAEVADTKPLAFSIGPVTTKELKDRGWDEMYESNSPHEADIIRAITMNYII